MIVQLPGPEPDERTEQERYEDLMERQARGAARQSQRSGWATGQPTCGACNLFISNPSSVCACGFDNGPWPLPQRRMSPSNDEEPMSTVTTPTRTPEQILASEPERKRGLKTPFRKEGDREQSFRWEIGRGRAFREDPVENVTLVAVLTIRHYKASDSRNGRAYYSATLIRHMIGDDGAERIKFDGSNGTTIHTQTAGAARFNAGALEEFADYALRFLREQRGDHPVVLGYFDPTNPAPGRE